jgi:hypothetical protein
MSRLFSVIFLNIGKEVSVLTTDWTNGVQSPAEADYFFL